MEPTALGMLVYETYRLRCVNEKGSLRNDRDLCVIKKKYNIIHFVEKCKG